MMSTHAPHLCVWVFNHVKAFGMSAALINVVDHTRNDHSANQDTPYTRRTSSRDEQDLSLRSGGIGV